MANYVNNTQTVDAEWDVSSSATDSNVINLGGGLLVGLVMPSTWTAADITLKAGPTDSTLLDVYDDAGNQETLTVAASRYVTVEPKTLVGANFVQLISSNNQAADRTVTVVFLPL